MSEWTTVTYKKPRKTTRKLPLAGVKNNFENKNNNKKPIRHKTIQKKSGQKDHYDPNHMRKLSDATEVNKLKKIDRSLALKIQRNRNKLGLTQKELASKMNVPLSIVVKYEKGDAINDNRIIQKFQNTLNI